MGLLNLALSRRGGSIPFSEASRLWVRLSRLLNADEQFETYQASLLCCAAKLHVGIAKKAVNNFLHQPGFTVSDRWFESQLAIIGGAWDARMAM